MTREIHLARPNLSQAEIDAVLRVLESPNLSLGPELPAFEQDFAKQCQTQRAVACSSGTAALHMVLTAREIARGDQVITTPFSFVASANAILMTGATPVFVDVDPHTWNLDPARLPDALTENTRAVLPVDVFGQPADMNPIMDFAARHDLFVLEDSCEALGSTYRKRPAGSLGHAGVFGFYPNKQITTGEGGMVVTDDEQLADRCCALRNQGRDPGDSWLNHSRLGYNYRLSDIQCALGRTQLARLPEIVDARSQVQAWYQTRLAGEPRLQLQTVIPDVSMSWFVFVVRLSDEYDQDKRDEIIKRLREKGIGCSHYFSPIHLQPFYVERFGFAPGDFPACEALSARTIALPFHHELEQQDVDWICTQLQALL